MAIALKSVDALQEHLRGVLEHADRQAGGVNEVLLAVIGGVLWRKNPGEPIRVGDKSGAGGNIIWFRIGLQRYALLYKYKAGRIELMLDSRHGHVLHAFTNATPLADVVRAFASLGLNDEVSAVPPAEAASEERQPLPAVGAVAEHVPEAAAISVEPPAAGTGQTGEPKKAARKTSKTTSKTPDDAAKAASAAKTARQRSKADRPPPEAGQLPLAGVADAAPKPPTTRKRRAAAKVPPKPGEAAAAAAPAVSPPAAQAEAAETKPRSRSRSKSAPPALQAA